MEDRATEKQENFLLKHGVAITGNLTKQEASKIIDGIINKPKEGKPEEKKEEPERYRQGTASYVNAAKDVFISLWTTEDSRIKGYTSEQVMGRAIELIKQAIEEFE